jgi:hypothetical protein
LWPLIGLEINSIKFLQFPAAKEGIILEDIDCTSHPETLRVVAVLNGVICTSKDLIAINKCRGDHIPWKCVPIKSKIIKVAMICPGQPDDTMDYEIYIKCGWID